MGLLNSTAAIGFESTTQQQYFIIQIYYLITFNLLSVNNSFTM